MRHALGNMASGQMHGTAQPLNIREGFLASSIAPVRNVSLRARRDL